MARADTKLDNHPTVKEETMSESSTTHGSFGKMKLEPEKGEIPLRKGILRFPSSPEEEPHLVASKCKSCGDIAFPPKTFCGKCEGEEVEEMLLGNKANVYSYTTVYQMGVPGVEVPHTIAIVKFPEDDELLVAGQMTDCAPEEVKVGMEVETVIDKVRSGKMPGTDVIGYKFRPVHRE